MTAAVIFTRLSLHGDDSVNLALSLIVNSVFFSQLNNYLENETPEDICENSTKIIQFIDVPGHQKYLKTTIYGLMGHSPHFAMLVMSANRGIGETHCFTISSSQLLEFIHFS